MATRRTQVLLAVLALLAPLAATATVACEPGAVAEHCPMMAAMAAGSPPCHGTSIQADDCCPEMAAAEPAEGVAVACATVVETAVSTPAPPAVANEDRSVAAQCIARSTPLYRLFRALLI